MHSVYFLPNKNDLDVQATRVFILSMFYFMINRENITKVDSHMQSILED